MIAEIEVYTPDGKVSPLGIADPTKWGCYTYRKEPARENQSTATICAGFFTSDHHESVSRRPKTKKSVELGLYNARHQFEKIKDCRVTGWRSPIPHGCSIIFSHSKIPRDGWQGSGGGGFLSSPNAKLRRRTRASKNALKALIRMEMTKEITLFVILRAKI